MFRRCNMKALEGILENEFITLHHLKLLTTQGHSWKPSPASFWYNWGLSSWGRVSVGHLPLRNWPDLTGIFIPAMIQPPSCNDFFSALASLNLLFTSVSECYLPIHTIVFFFIKGHSLYMSIQSLAALPKTRAFPREVPSQGRRPPAAPHSLLFFLCPPE